MILETLDALAQRAILAKTPAANVAPKAASAQWAEVRRSQTASVTVNWRGSHAPSNTHSEAAKALVNQLTFALSMSQPSLPIQRVEIAYFTRQLFLVGEIELQDFIRRMRNLFPERMDALGRDFNGRIAALSAAH